MPQNAPILIIKAPIVGFRMEWTGVSMIDILWGMFVLSRHIVVILRFISIKASIIITIVGTIIITVIVMVVYVTRVWWGRWGLGAAEKKWSSPIAE